MPVESISDNKHHTNQAGVSVVAGLVYEKPISLRLQQSASAQIRVGFNNLLNKYEITGMPDVSSYNGSIPSLGFSAHYGYGFYPNSRTRLTAGWFLNSTYNEQFIGTSKSDKENSQNNFYANTGPGFQAYYYISEKLRLSVTFNGYYNVNSEKFISNIPEGSGDKQTNSHWEHQLNATLTYSLF